MTELEEKKAIWSTINGSESLLGLYGYYPTLHDANVTNIDTRFDEKEIYITFEYSDLIDKPSESYIDEKSLSTKIVMRWDEVSDALLQISENHISHLILRRIGDRIKTEFTGSFTINGYIFSKSIEVVSADRSGRDSHSDLGEFLHTVNLRWLGR